MKYILWYIYEGSPRARIKKLAIELQLRLAGQKKRKEIQRQLDELESQRPIYKYSKEINKQ